MSEHPTITIAGAGSVGCFVGGLLLAAGREVRFLARKRIATKLKQHGLHLTDYTGLDKKIAPDFIEISDSPAMLGGADIVLVCVKSGATSEMAETIRQHVPQSAIIISLQNGVNNAARLRKHLPGFDVRAGMVPFNIVQTEDARFHRGTSGEMVIEAGASEITNLLNVQHLKTKASDDMQSVLWGKLLVNLNNALNALSGMPLVEQLAQRSWRVQLAMQMIEALTVMKAEGITPKPPSPVPASFLPHILRLPTPIFRIVAKSMLAIDPTARSSLWEDLQLSRKTEIDELQGVIVELGKKHGISTPECERVMGEIAYRTAK